MRKTNASFAATCALIASLSSACSKSTAFSDSGHVAKKSPVDAAHGADPANVGDGGGSGSHTGVPGAEGGLGENGSDTSGTGAHATAGNGANASVAGDGLKVDCKTKNVSILVVDLKSGWWAGDGGEFVQKSLSSLKGLCAGAHIDYHHLLSGDDMDTGNESKHISFGADGSENEDKTAVDFNTYGEIWLLSGSHGDSADYRVDEAPFKVLIERIAASKANLFIGAGFGSVTHANALGERLGLGTLFKPTQEEGNVLSFDGAPENLKTLTPGGDELFQGVKTLADVIRMDGQEASSDDIVMSGAKVIASDAAGHKVIATASAGGRKVVIDAGLQRLYAIAVSGTDTGTYLQNLVATLGR